MTDIKQSNLKDLKDQIEKEFINDPALQKVHLARKIILMEAEAEGLSYFDYLKKQVKQMKAVSK